MSSEEYQKFCTVYRWEDKKKESVLLRQWKLNAQFVLLHCDWGALSRFQDKTIAMRVLLCSGRWQLTPWGKRSSNGLGSHWGTSSSVPLGIMGYYKQVTEFIINFRNWLNGTCINQATDYCCQSTVRPIRICACNGSFSKAGISNWIGGATKSFETALAASLESILLRFGESCQSKICNWQHPYLVLQKFPFSLEFPKYVCKRNEQVSISMRMLI